MFNLLRKPKPAPKPIAPEAVAAGLRAFADDLDAGDVFALDCVAPNGEMPSEADGWAGYPEFARWLRMQTDLASPEDVEGLGASTAEIACRRITATTRTVFGDVRGERIGNRITEPLGLGRIDICRESPCINPTCHDHA